MGGTQLNASNVERLNGFLTYSKGCDANVSGRIFTWKKLLRGKFVYVRIILRNDCFQLFPNYLVTNEPFTYSNHVYVLLKTEPNHTP